MFVHNFQLIEHSFMETFYKVDQLLRTLDGSNLTKEKKMIYTDMIMSLSFLLIVTVLSSGGFGGENFKNNIDVCKVFQKEIFPFGFPPYIHP